ncbi:hypothetical protein N0K08_19330 [Acidovorax sp. Be4]|uniref:Uncharacterized protein n=1 Tax=Acidovorax bellezanensis TaxID=2976702 RepID=A0ABT2PQP5_9BURK|nr:hypothetical protein [Acidovorax sp. Be4]MCT9812790.1 hypothetical protein [Acidovorax sp. Be4]
MLSQLVQDLQKSIDEAQKIQTAVLRLHAQHGLDPRNPGAALEQRMSREEIAKAHAAAHGSGKIHSTHHVNKAR